MSLLAREVRVARAQLGLSRDAVAERAGCNPSTVVSIEAGRGTLASLCAVTRVLNCFPSPFPSALANMRKWLGMGTRTLAERAQISRPTLKALEATGVGLIAKYEAVCAALGETPTLLPIEETWSTPLSEHVASSL